jgi:hypothetical protein
VSADLSAAGPQAMVSAVRVQVTFHVRDERQAHAVAERMVDRAHEIANMPECECDLDVSVERMRTDLAHPVDPGDALARGRPAGL